MNRTNWEHTVLGLLLMLAIWVALALLGLPFGQWFGFAVAVTFFAAREYTQHEYKIGKQRGWQWGQVLPVKWWEGFVRGWSRDSLLDLLAPVIVCLLVAWCVPWLFW